MDMSVPNILIKNLLTKNLGWAANAFTNSYDQIFKTESLKIDDNEFCDVWTMELSCDKPEPVPVSENNKRITNLEEIFQL